MVDGFKGAMSHQFPHDGAPGERLVAKFHVRMFCPTNTTQLLWCTTKEDTGVPPADSICRAGVD